MKRHLFTVVTLTCFAGAAGWASSITITNPSFEDPASGAIQNGVATGWLVSNGNAGTWNPTGFVNAVPDGNQVLFVGYVGGAAEVSQTLANNLQANTDYTLTFYLGRRTDLTLSNYSVALMANGNTLASDTGGTAAAGDFVFRQIFWQSGANPAGLNSPLEIDINATGLDGLGGGAQAEFDQFTLTAVPTGGGGPSPTPEPASMALMGAGLVLLGVLRRKQT
jgi:hypothetical protein